MKFKNKFRSISIITAATLPFIIGSAVVFGSVSDVVNQNLINSTRNIK